MKNKNNLDKTEEALSAETMRDIAQALEDYEKGKGTTLKEFKKELGIQD